MLTIFLFFIGALFGSLIRSLALGSCCFPAFHPLPVPGTINYLQMCSSSAYVPCSTWRNCSHGCVDHLLIKRRALARDAVISLSANSPLCAQQKKEQIPALKAALLLEFSSLPYFRKEQIPALKAALLLEFSSLPYFRLHGSNCLRSMHIITSSVLTEFLYLHSGPHFPVQ